MAANRISNHIQERRKRMMHEAQSRFGPTVEDWLAVFTTVNAEELAAEELRLQGYAVFYPQVQVHHRKKRPGVDAYVTEIVPKPYFPRYIFCGRRTGQDAGIMPINETRGVQGVVCFGEGPVRIPHKVIDEMMLKADSDGIMARIDERNKLARKLFLPETRVRVGSGPFSGLIGFIISDNLKSARVWLEQFDREVSMPGEHLMAE